MTIITDDRCTGYSSPGHPERPARISRTLEKLRAQTELPLKWAAPLEPTTEQLLRAHSKPHVALVKNPDGPFDGDTPAHPNIYDHASRSVGAALHALKLARAGEPAFSLM